MTPFIFTLNDLQLLYAGLAAERKLDYLNLYNAALLIIHIQLRQIERDVWLALSSNGAAAVSAAAGATTLLRQIASTEFQMDKWPNTLSPQSTYTTVQLPLDDPIDLWGTDAHVYPTFSAGNDWSRYRMLQLLAHSLRLRAYRIIYGPLHGFGQPGFDHENAQLSSLAGYVATTHSKIRAIANDICASMPYHLGYRSKLKPGLCYPGDSFPSGKYPRLLSACQIIWPLYVAGIVEGVDAAQRLWISRQLAFINAEMGIGKAAMLSELVRRAAVTETQSLG